MKNSFELMSRENIRHCQNCGDWTEFGSNGKCTRCGKE